MMGDVDMKISIEHICVGIMARKPLFWGIKKLKENICGSNIYT